MSKLWIAPLEGDQVRLRLLTVEDLPRTFAWRNQDHIRRWFTHSEPLIWEAHQTWFQRYSARNDDYLFIIERADASRWPVGQISLYRIDWQARVAEYGRILIGEPQAERRGYAREATALLLEFAFEAWQLRVIELEVLADNERAVHLYRSCGFEPLDLKNNLLRMRITREQFRTDSQPWVAAHARVPTENVL